MQEHLRKLIFYPYSLHKFLFYGIMLPKQVACHTIETHIKQTRITDHIYHIACDFKRMLVDNHDRERPFRGNKGN